MVLAPGAAPLHRGERVAKPNLRVDEVLSMLEEHPRRIAAATAGISAARLRDEPVLGEWSARDILAHLRSCSDARGEFIPKILASQRPTLRAIDPRTLIESTNYRKLEFASSFRAFARQRARLLRLLQALPRGGWVRSAIVTGGGPARERTVLFYGAWLARHERAHVRHIERLASAVGGPSRASRPVRRGSSTRRRE